MRGDKMPASYSVRAHHYFVPLALEGRVYGSVQVDLPHARRLRLDSVGGHQAVAADGPKDLEDHKYANDEDSDRDDRGHDPRVGSRRLRILCSRRRGRRSIRRAYVEPTN